MSRLKKDGQSEKSEVFHSPAPHDSRLLECNSVSLCKQMFQRTVAPSSSQLCNPRRQLDPEDEKYYNLSESLKLLAQKHNTFLEA